MTKFTIILYLSEWLLLTFSFKANAQLPTDTSSHSHYCRLLEAPPPHLRAARLAKPSTSRSSKTTSNTVLYAEYKFKGESKDPISVDLEAVKEFFLRSSYGQFHLNFTRVPKVIELPYTRKEYVNGTSSRTQDLNDQLKQQGYNYKDYDLFIERVDAGSPIPNANKGGFGTALLVSYQAAVACHEIGHNVPYLLGIGLATLGHGNLWDTDVKNAVIGPGKAIEYADQNNIMGSGANRTIDTDFNLGQKIRFGWLGDNDYHRVDRSGVYRIYPLDMGTRSENRKYGVFIDRTNKALGASSPRKSFYHFHYQVRNSRAGENYQNGVVMTTFENLVRSYLFRTQEDYKPAFKGAPLVVGETFKDDEFDIRVKTLRQGGSGANSWIEIEVTLDGEDSDPATPEEDENNLTVRARGVTGNERIALWLDDKPVATWSLSTSFANYTYRGDVAGKNLKVAYINDNQPAWDVVVDYLQMDDQVLQAEDQAVNTGAWENGSCGGSYSENMYCQGYVDFGSITTRLATSAAKETLSAKGSGSLVSYPNPSSGQVSFSRTVSLRLINPVGQEVLSATKVTSLDVSNLPTGVYTIQFATGELNKLVVE